jgi:cytidine deaminase
VRAAARPGNGAGIAHPADAGDTVAMTQDELIGEARKVAGEFPLSAKSLSAGSVGAALLSASGRVYTGICIDVWCGMGFCAEHAAIAEMLKARETRIAMAVAVADDGTVIPPCGRCRELMSQIDARNRTARIIVAPGKVVELSELLPWNWRDAWSAS